MDSSLSTRQENVAAVTVKELVQQSLAGERASTSAIVEQFEGRVFGLCYRMLGHRADAEDATQETFIRVFRSLHRWDPTREFLPWLFAIAGNRCRTMLSKRSRQAHFRLIDETIEQPEGSGDSGREGDLGEEVQLALARLKENHRLAFVLFHDQELSYSEIAESLNCPVGTVKTWIHRARKELARWLARRYPELGKDHALHEL